VAAPSALFAALSLESGNRYVLETRRSRADERFGVVVLGIHKCIDDMTVMSIHAAVAAGTPGSFAEVEIPIRRKHVIQRPPRDPRA